MWKSLLRPFNYAFRGLSVVWREERNFRIQTFCAAVATIFMAWFEFSAIECIVTIFAIVLVLTAEIINTAIEDLCNRIEPNHDPLIGKIKDIMSAFVLVSCFGAFMMGVITFYSHFT